MAEADTPRDFDKYQYYLEAVQSPDTDVEFIRGVYRELRKRDPVTLREDFCGTFMISCEWVKLNSKFMAYGVDLDSEPINYGIANYLTKLSDSQQARIKIRQGNVLDKDLPRVDIVAAMNFSHYIFKTRDGLKAYFKNCFDTLNRDGILLVDCFGGTRCQEANEEVTNRGKFKYYWDQQSFDPVTHEASFRIHFKPKDGKKIKDVFSYDWRMWTIPELREVMQEVGFKNTWVYWEGTTRKGEGDGNFKRSKVGEECEAWIAYVVGEK
jgi:hypothetical protein